MDSSAMWEAAGKSWNHSGWKRSPKPSIPAFSTALNGKGDPGRCWFGTALRDPGDSWFYWGKSPCPPQLPRPVHGFLPGGGKAAQKDPWRLQQDGKDGKDRREWEGRQLLSHRGSHLRSSGTRVPAAAPAAPRKVPDAAWATTAPLVCVSCSEFTAWNVGKG